MNSKTHLHLFIFTCSTIHALLAQSTIVHSIHIEIILHVGILNALHHVNVKIPSGATVMGEGGVAGKVKFDGVSKFYSWGKCAMTFSQIVCHTFPLACVITCIIIQCCLSITAPQDAHTRIVL